MTAKKKGLLLVGSGAFIYGLEPVLAKLCYSAGFSVVFLLFTRFIFSAVIMLLIALIIRQPLFLPRGQLKIGLLLGVLSTFTTATLFKAFELLPAAVAVMFFYMYPSFTSIFARIFNKVPITKIRIMAIITCFLGFFLLYWGSFELNFDMIGIISAILAAVFMAVLMILLEKYMPEVNKISYSTTVYLVSGVIYFAASIMSKDLFAFGQIEASGWIYLLLMVIVITIISNLLFFYGMSTAPAVDASILNSLEVPSAAIFAFIIFGDYLVGWQAAGAVLIVFAAIAPALADKIIFRMKKVQASENSQA